MGEAVNQTSDAPQLSTGAYRVRRRVWLRKKGLVKFIRAIYHQSPYRPLVVVLPPEEMIGLKEHTSRSALDLVEAITSSVSEPGEPVQDSQSMLIPRDRIVILPSTASLDDALGQILICLNQPAGQVVVYQGEHWQNVTAFLCLQHNDLCYALLDVAIKIETVWGEMGAPGKVSCVGVAVEEFPAIA